MLPLKPKPTLVLVPGTLCDVRVFARQVRLLRGQARVQCLAYCGINWRGDWAAQLLKTLPARFSIAGFSLGGMVALELLRRAPERVERLALICSNAEPASSTAQKRSKALRRIWQARGPEAVVRYNQTSYFHHAAQRHRHAALLADMARRTSRRAALGEFEWAAARPSAYATLAAFTGPVLIASSAKDRVCPPGLQQRMALAQPKAHWREVENCGHFMPLEAAGQLGAALSFWLGEPVF